MSALVFSSSTPSGDPDPEWARAITPPRATTPSSSGPERARLTLDVQHLFNDEALSDIILRLQCLDGSAAIYGHRLVLVVSSSYFSSALSKQWQPTTDQGGAPSEITMSCDEKLAHVRTFLEFLYGREVELTLDCAHPLLRLSDFYGVDKLGELCLDYLECVLHPEPTRCFQLFAEPNVLGTGSVPDSMGADVALDLAPNALSPQAPAQPRLLALCAEVLARSFSDASVHEKFLSCPTELLLAVLQRDDLSVDREVEVLAALLKWAAHEPSREGSLSELLSLVRWPMITGEVLAEIEEFHALLATEAARGPLREHLLEALKYQAASPSRKQSIVRDSIPDVASRYRPRTPNMVRLQGEGKFCWTLKNFSRLATEERIYSPPFTFSGIAFMLLFFPRGNQQREYASLYVSVDKTKLDPGWRREVHFTLCVVDQKESLCSVTKSTHGELSNQVLDWGFTELIQLSSLNSPSHGYIMDDTLQFTIQFERVTEGSSGRSRPGGHSTPHAAGLAKRLI